MSVNKHFTLIEMLVVIGIIVLLAGLIFPALKRARESARRAECTSNLTQMSKGIELYRANNRAKFPSWITMLQSSYLPNVGDKSAMVCPNDNKSKGEEGGVPAWVPNAAETTYDDRFPNANKDGPCSSPSADDPTNSADGGIDCSYLYEFNAYTCEWSSSNTWYEAKMKQVEAGYTYIPFSGPDRRLYTYPSGDVPVVRCFWHCSKPTLDNKDYVLNVRYNYAVDHTIPYWELEYPSEAAPN